MKRAFSLLLALCLVLSLLPFGTFAAPSGSAAADAASSTVSAGAAADVTSYLAFSSDVHNSGNNTSANRLNQWIGNVTAKIGDEIDVMSFCGDNGSASAGESDFWTYTQAVMNTVDSHSKVHDSVFTTGNHEFYNGKYETTQNAVAQRIIRIGEARRTDDYIIYAFGPRDWSGSKDRFDAEDLTILDEYLGSLSEADRAKPIFILSHFPAHSYNGGWITRATANADQLISTLNKYGGQGYDLYFLWGHNHTVSDTHYDEVITGSLDGTEINFTYLAAGCMSDSEYGTGSAFVKGKGLLIGIDNRQVVSIKYYDANGNDVTEDPSGAEPPAPPADPDFVSELSVTPTTANPTVSAAIHVGDTLTITVTNSSTYNAYDFTASLSSNDAAELLGDATVNIARGASGVFTLRGLAPGAVDITIQNGNSQYNRRATIHLTVVSDGADPTTPPACEHPSSSLVGALDASCTEEGYTGNRVCDTCGEVLEYGETIPALGHDLERRNASDATCTEPGYSGDDVCTRCGNTIAWGRVLPAAGHDWSEWTIVGNVSTRTCLRCGETETERLPEPGSSTFALTSTLGDGQEYLIVSVNDGAGYALVNNNGSVSAVPVTVSGGRIVLENDAAVWACGTNSKGFTFANSGRWLDASYSGLRLVSAADSNRGWNYSNDQLKLSGSYSTYTMYYSSGFKAAYNSSDGRIYLFARTAAACAHENQMLIDAKDASCTEEGFTGNLVCADCGETISTGEVIPALGHDWDDGVVTQQPTGSAEGVRTFTCSRCAETRTESIPKLENPFHDVAEGKYYTDAVLWAVHQEPQITTGYAGGAFLPDNHCTRAHVVTFLWRAAGEPEPESSDVSFTDVSPSAYYCKAVLWAVEKGVTTGYADHTFRPNAECTRAHVVTFLWRAEGSPEPARTDHPFTDVSPSAYYCRAVLWALENGVTTGSTATTFHPNGVCTRAHVVTFLYRSVSA